MGSKEERLDPRKLGKKKKKAEVGEGRKLHGHRRKNPNVEETFTE